MKGAKPDLRNVIPMKGDVAPRPVPDAPEFMSDTARKVWDELAGVLVGKGRLEPSYVYQFAAYCESVANFIETTACLAIEGKYYETKTRNGLQQKKTASWGQQQEAMSAMARGAALFGLSPVDEARLKVTGQGDLFDDLMKQLKNGPG
ncbi:P27 family phage terminase small subunit [Pseudotabrizicola sp. 4114]|uniref:P27 family phage terminase small subunit n=1 Tax=Pseudotabrizicola sp. 4114 TaxID=2817731 RepID=UPI002857BE9E|nr:P27 family predicted phage terminase small subunit [Pseudorhodobacter sp. 4114]